MKEKEVVQEFLFCEPLKTTTKAVDVFNSVKEFFLNHEMSLDMVGLLCTDGAPAMLGNKSGFASLVKKEIPHITVTHCKLHRHALAAESLPQSRSTPTSCPPPKVSARAPAHRSYHFRGVKLKSCIKKIHHNLYISKQANVRIKHADTEGASHKKFGTDARVQ